MTNCSIFGRKVSAAVSGGPSAKMLIIGHSHVAGQGSGICGGTTNAALNGFSEKLAESFEEYGISAKRTGWLGDYNTSVDGVNINTFDNRIGFGTGWVSHPSNIILGGRHIYQDGATAGKGFLCYRPGFAFNDAKIWYPTSPGLSSSVGVYLDDVLFTSISQAGANSISCQKLEIGDSKTTLKVRENAGLSAFWNGVEFFPVDKPDIAITVAGGRGQMTAAFVDASSAWSTLHGLETFGADLVVLYVMTNDLLTSVSVSAFKANLALLAVTSVVRGNCIIVIDPPASNAKFVDGTYEAYAEAAASVAAQYGCGIVDTRTTFSRSWDRANSDLLMNDFAHPNDAGHAYIADLIAAEAMRFVA